VAADIRVVTADCRTLPTSHEGQYRLAFMDPPFNIGQAYLEHGDKMPQADFEALVTGAMDAGARALLPNGVLAVHGPDSIVDIALPHFKTMGWRRLAWVNWIYAFGICRRTNWVDARCHCLFYTRPGQAKHVWNPDAVLRPTTRGLMGDKRSEQSPTPGLRVPGTVWGVPEDGPYWGRVQGNSEERVPDVPNQLPEVYLARIVQAYTMPGEWVLDLFAGSGTMPTVCKALGRNCTAVDISTANKELILQRLARGAVRIKGSS
jgi:site-specific DNA-methyltransferase (adenine-specific)